MCCSIADFAVVVVENTEFKKTNQTILITKIRGLKRIRHLPPNSKKWMKVRSEDRKMCEDFGRKYYVYRTQLMLGWYCSGP